MKIKPKHQFVLGDKKYEHCVKCGHLEENRKYIICSYHGLLKEKHKHSLVEFLDVPGLKYNKCTKCNKSDFAFTVKLTSSFCRYSDTEGMLQNIIK